ncbi:MAG: CPBP family intramembrane glutamic endopeptidase [Bryobacteraceae bacterium]
MTNSPGREGRVGLAAGMLLVGAGWVLLGLGAWIYARMKGIPEWAAIPVAAAFLIEFPFYLFPGFDASRDWLSRRGKTHAASLLTASAIAPWLVYSLATGEARLVNFCLLLIIAFVVSFWYVVWPPAPLVDAWFLMMIAGTYLSKAFDGIYLSPIPRQSISVLGHLMLIRMGALAVLILRGNVDAEFRFLPNRREWLTGLRYFIPALPVVGFSYWALGLAQPRVHPLGVLQGIGTFLLILWVVALSEEFFFRGLLQQWLEGWTGNGITALIFAAVVFGSAHLGFHRIFPNWRWAIVAAVLGLFLGLAWRSARSVQASMVTHALIVTVWRVFFQ